VTLRPMTTLYRTAHLGDGWRASEISSSGFTHHRERARRESHIAIHSLTRSQGWSRWKGRGRRVPAGPP
jgi:hypothetical protein